MNRKDLASIGQDFVKPSGRIRCKLRGWTFSNKPKLNEALRAMFADGLTGAFTEYAPDVRLDHQSPDRLIITLTAIGDDDMYETGPTWTVKLQPLVETMLNSQAEDDAVLKFSKTLRALADKIDRAFK